MATFPMKYSYCTPLSTTDTILGCFLSVQVFHSFGHSSKYWYLVDKISIQFRLHLFLYLCFWDILPFSVFLPRWVHPSSPEHYPSLLPVPRSDPAGRYPSTPSAPFNETGMTDRAEMNLAKKRLRIVIEVMLLCQCTINSEKYWVCYWKLCFYYSSIWSIAHFMQDKGLMNSLPGQKYLSFSDLLKYLDI